MDKKAEGFWEGVDVPSFGDFLTELDRQLVEVMADPNSIFLRMLTYFDSVPSKPLTPRELLHFWNSITEEERMVFVFEFS